MQAGHVEACIQQGTNSKTEHTFTAITLRMVSILNNNFITFTPSYSSIEVTIKKIQVSLIVIDVSFYHNVLSLQPGLSCS